MSDPREVTAMPSGGADPDHWTAQAEKLVGPHADACDSWLSNATGGPQSCDCYRVERVIAIAAALRDEHDRGRREALEEAALLVRYLDAKAVESASPLRLNSYHCAQIDAIAAIRAKLAGG